MNEREHLERLTDKELLRLVNETRNPVADTILLDRKNRPLGITEEEKARETRSNPILPSLKIKI
jgi:hypothetical protein